MSKLIRDLSFYAATGLTMSQSRTIKSMLAEATKLTGTKYQRHMCHAAIGDLVILSAASEVRA